MKKRFISTIMTMMLLFAMLVSNVYAAVQYEYMGIYAAESGSETISVWPYIVRRDKDMTTFCDKMEDLNNGIWTETKKDSTGEKDDIEGYDSSGNQTDLLYWTSHGLPSGIMSYYNGSTYVDYSSSSWKGVDQVGNTITNWNSTNGYTSDSKWNEDLDWAIIAACSQFKDSSLRQKWARTLLGTPSRAHSVWGYNWYTHDGTAQNSAPGAPIDYRVAEDFVDYCDGGDSVKYAWIMANRDNGRYNWAGLTHYNNRYDRLWGEGTTYATTDTTAIPNIRYYYEGLSDPIYGTGTYTSVSNINNLNIIASSDDSMIEKFSDNSYNKSTINKINSENGLIIDATVYMPSNNEVQSIIVVEHDYDIDLIAENVLKDKKEELEKKEKEVNNATRVTYSKNGSFVKKTDNNKIVIYNHELEDDGKRFTKENNTEIVLKYLNDNNLVEEDMYPVMTTSILQERIIFDEDIKAGNASSDIEKTQLASIVTYGRAINGLPISIHSGEYMSLIVDTEGVSSVSKNWNTSIKAIYSSKPIIDVDEAAEFLLSNNSLELNISTVALVYAPDKEHNVEGEILYAPVWEFWDGNGTVVQIDAYTGEFIKQ